MQLIITKRDLQQIIDHCAAGLPNEACGILGGRHGRVEKVYGMRNVRPTPVSYEMDPVEQFQVLKDLRGEALGLSAIFHSHPTGPACPSGIDVERAYWPGTVFPNYPEALYVILSLQERDEPEIKAFAIGEGAVREVLLEIE